MVPVEPVNKVVSRWVLADVNGDGLDDLVMQVNVDTTTDVWRVALNEGGHFGAMLAGWMIGRTLDSQIKLHGAQGWNALFWSMVPFSVLGMLLMSYIWFTTRGRDVKGS